MDTIRVDIRYRPLRIAWAICAGDITAFRQAVRHSYTLWGGKFNPIIVVDREEEADQLIDVFRVDLIIPLGSTDKVRSFPKRFPYLISPFFPDAPTIGGPKERKRSQALDIHNALIHLREKPEWKHVKDAGVAIFTWQPDDPLADVFMVQLGSYPSFDEIGINYRDVLARGADATEFPIKSTMQIPEDVLKRPSIEYMSRHGLQPHYGAEKGWDSPGFFVGDGTNVDDLVAYWNLCASGISLWFVDPNSLNRYRNLIPAWEKVVRRPVAPRHESERRVALWSRNENSAEVCRPFGDMKLTCCRVSEGTWNGRSVLPPTMHFAQVSTLGVIGRQGDKPRVSFSLNDKPFCGNAWFHTQHLVASLSVLGQLDGDEQYTLRPPFIPELNEFYSRTMHFEHDKLRIEPEQVGLVIGAADKDAFLFALPVADLVERIFAMAGIASKPSSAGLTTRQLIAQMGGLQNTRVFKIPGVRRLLKTYGPTKAFTKSSAIDLIRSSDLPDARFSAEHENLYIEPRRPGTKLEPRDVFSHLVGKGVFRIGAELHCPNCRMPSWTALDALKQWTVCALCGHEYDASRQLADNGEWHYRRTGVLGVERNAQGAIPVVLTLQRLDTTFREVFNEHLYSTSLDLDPKEGFDLPKCEVDFVWVIARIYPRKPVVVLGECKDQGYLKKDEFEQDVDNLRRVADSLPRKRFKTFVILAKMNPFTGEEIEIAKRLNDRHRHRAILLTARELEPFHIYERTKREIKIDSYSKTPEDLAEATAVMYFNNRPSDTAPDKS